MRYLFHGPRHQFHVTVAFCAWAFCPDTLWGNAVVKSHRRPSKTFVVCRYWEKKREKLHLLLTAQQISNLFPLASLILPTGQTGASFLGTKTLRLLSNESTTHLWKTALTWETPNGAVIGRTGRRCYVCPKSLYHCISELGFLSFPVYCKFLFLQTTRSFFVFFLSSI